MSDGTRKARFFALMERYVHLGSQLPSDADVIADPHKRADAKVILAEMNKTAASIDAIVKRIAQPPPDCAN